MNKNKIESALSNISNDYIVHHGFDECGHSILFMEKRGLAFCRLFWYNDDEKTVYIDFLSVDESIRKKGVGTKLKEITEDLGRRLKADNAILSVVKESWMHEWYKRRGYSDYYKHEDEKLIWMIKSLK